MRKRTLTTIAAALCLVGGAACGSPGDDGGDSSGELSPSTVPETPSEPQTLNILDVAGNLQLTKGMIENFVEENPDIVSRVNYSEATAPEMPGKLQAQQAAGEVNIHLVLTGTDGLSAGLQNDLLVEVLPDYAETFPDLEADYQEPAAAMHELAQGHGVTVTYYPSGPLLEYNPEAVSDLPSSPQELLEWAKANPGRFQYAQPKNSGPGRTLLMGLPYLLGDKNPRDPENGWDKTWAYLEELGKYIEYYPSGTTETMENLAAGSVDMIASTTGWDINPRVLGVVPQEMEVTMMQPMTWVTDAHYAVIPKGVSPDQMSAVLNLIEWMLQPDQQAIAYDDGYFYPGPAVEGVTLDMAPEESQEAIEEFGRPEYEQWIEQYPKETSLPAEQQVTAFDIWDRTIGAGRVRD